MRLFLVLLASVIISWLNIDKLSISSNKRFMYKVVGNCFSKYDDQLCFAKDEVHASYKRDGGYVNHSMRLTAIYTSSKAVYKIYDSYLGVVVVDANIYITETAPSISEVDFDMLRHVGQEKRHL